MARTYDGYQRSGYWFLLLLPLLAVGFYNTYFSKIFQSEFLVDLHFGLMATWILMVILQPILISYRKLRWHRRIGQVSYFTLPALLVTAFLMIRHSYYHFLDGLAAASPPVSGSEALQQAADYETIAFIYFGWLFLFYTLGVINRKNVIVHSRYMMVAGLGMLGPGLDRIFYYGIAIDKFPGGIPIETLTFVISDLLLLIFLLRDRKLGRSIKPLGIALIIFIASQLFFYLIPGSDGWSRLVAILMKPSP